MKSTEEENLEYQKERDLFLYGQHFVKITEDKNGKRTKERIDPRTVKIEELKNEKT